ncbi:MAG: zinc dependent phospholipase C family protein, partial [Chloroflexi bacterium]|nr:zinc dependent phospholipase C family protein [Chloroflexota bacterium]
AEQLLAVLPQLDETAFIYGNLAPDSGLPNADWSAFDPPKEVTHFLRPGEDEGRIKDLEFYRGYLADLAASNGARFSFVLGYFMHLVCDNLWSKRIVSASKRDYAQLLAERGREAWGIFKDDWYGLDVIYVREHPDCSFWRVLMQTPNPPAYLPFVSEAGLHHQLDHIRQFYSQPDLAWVLGRPYPYLSEPTMTRFVDDAAHALVKIWAQSARLAQLDHSPSALALLAPEELAPYAAPLGDR